MIHLLYEALTLDVVINFCTSIFGVTLGAAIAIYGQFKLTKWQKDQATQEDAQKRNDFRYGALVEAQVALFRQAEIIIQLKKDLLDHPNFQAARESNEMLPAYESIVSAPMVRLENIAFLAQGMKNEKVDAELLHEILLAQASYENMRLVIERHNKHDTYLKLRYPGEIIEGKLHIPMAPNSYDAHLARNLADKLYELSPQTINQCLKASMRIAEYVQAVYPNHMPLKFTEVTNTELSRTEKRPSGD
jgi:hypothetical protein